MLPSHLDPTSLIPHDDGWFHHRSFRKADQPGSPLPAPVNTTQAGALSSLSPSTLVPLPTSEGTAVASFSSTNEGSRRYYSQVAARVQNSGLATAHVVGLSSCIHAEVAEIPDAAGQSSQQAARKEAGGRDARHYFGQPVLHSRDGLAPFSGPLAASPLGTEQTAGHFEAGSGVDLVPTVELGQPRPLSRRGRRGITEPVREQGQGLNPLSPGGVRQTAAHRDTFGGQAAAALLKGGA